MLHVKKVGVISTYLCILGFIILLFITIINPNPPLFDEVLFIPNVLLFEEYGMNKEFLIKLYDQAPGPLYQFIHYPLKPLTNLTTPGIRLVNIGLLILTTIILIQFTRKWLASYAQQNIYFPIIIIAIPMTWQISGMALTEIPAIFTSSLFLISFILFIRNDDNRILRVVYSVSAGVFLGLTILGRSPYLMILPGLLVPFILITDNYKRFLIVITGVIAASISFPVFYIWGGLVPPAQVHVGVGGIVVRNGILAFAYMFLVVLLLAPKWYEFRRSESKGIIIAFILAFIINSVWLKSEYAPLSDFLGKIFPALFLNIYKLIINPMLITMGVYFLYTSARKIQHYQHDAVYVFLLVTAILILATCFKVTHLFSSRYVAQAVPFIIPLLALSDTNDLSKPFRIILGFIIGFISLNTYNPLF